MAVGTRKSGTRERATPTTAHVECACATPADGGRKAVGVDPGIKESNLNRLRRIEGQVRGLQKMVDDDRYCADIMT